MGKVHECITPRLREWIEAQHLFFIATAPLDPDGHLNLSPRGTPGTFAVIDEMTVAWLDLTGSGVETIAHLRENGRIVVMFCAFDGPPQIVRLHGRGRTVLPADPEWEALAPRFVTKRGARAIVVVDVTRVSDSCGFGIPRFEFVDDRDLLDSWADNRGDEGLAAYRETRNAASIDGLPALSP
jgi:Pyridoxamine 5'-phosphate oxidase